MLYDSYLKKNDKKKMNGNIVSYFLDAIIYECKWTKQNKKYVSCNYKIIKHIFETLLRMLLFWGGGGTT